ncbi:DUF2207 domain-containing protein [Propioniciclava soli]|uniref:DUF2207 domain-containing protein n=1 Tax=Propioniciclava soli TaxID=2775081 RepID=A0ABZ3C8U1_9ACTN
MTRTLRATVLGILAAVLGLLVFAGAPATARADEDNWAINRYDVTARVDADGTAHVTVDLDFDFADEPGHGPFVALVEQQRVEGNPDVWRRVSYDLGEVTSSTGAPTDVETSHEDGSLLVRIGDEDVEVGGVQNYRLEYTARGLIAPQQATSGLDEVNWNVVGTGWQVPLRNVSLTLSGPTNIQRTACFWGSGFTEPCTHDATAATATYSHDLLEPGEGLQAVAGFPSGTFVGAGPVFEKRYHPGNLFPLTPATGLVTAALTVLGVGAVLLRTRRGARDEAYLGLTPGVRPAPGQEAAVGAALAKAPVTVAFTPPKGARPGEVGVLLDATADDVDVTATIIDLAVRGHVQISEAGRGWRFTERRTDDPLTGPEAHVLNTLFSAGNQVTTKELEDKRYHDLLPGTRGRLYARVTRDLHWFAEQPNHSRTIAAFAGVAIAVAGVILGAILAVAAGWGLVGLALLITGVLVMALSNRFGRRTAEGSAVLAEAKGFELYLRTAEADQIRFEEGIDIFSRYLPYAIVFGVADRWVKIFSDLAARGQYTPDDWYIGPSGFFYGASFGNALNSLSGNLSSAMQASVANQTQATAGSSGGSGFSGGGGFGGGGGGGW